MFPMMHLSRPKRAMLVMAVHQCSDSMAMTLQTEPLLSHCTSQMLPNRTHPDVTRMQCGSKVEGIGTAKRDRERPSPSLFALLKMEIKALLLCVEATEKQGIAGEGGMPDRPAGGWQPLIEGGI